MKGRKKQAAAWLVIASLLVCITGEHAPAGRALAAPATPGSLSLEGEGRTPEEERWLQDIPFYYDEPGKRPAGRGHARRRRAVLYHGGQMDFV